MLPPQTRSQRRFLSVLDLAEQKLRDGAYGPTLNALAGELSRLSQDADVASLMSDGDSELAERFDACLQAVKELRRERQGQNRRCRDCYGALHTEDRCPFRWAR